VGGGLRLGVVLLCVFISAVPTVCFISRFVCLSGFFLTTHAHTRGVCVFYYCPLWTVANGGLAQTPPVQVCVLLLQNLLQSCSRGGQRIVEDMCYERRRAEACVD